jgi:preprotein translocase subunit SecA
MVRADKNDQVYKTREGKWSAVEREIAERHTKGQPVLVGTISVEVSELLGERLRRRGIPHAVLNAKPEHAEREGEVIAEAGRPGAVTIATNMAGRGVDIKLGGNAEHQTQLEMAKLGLSPGDPDYAERFAQVLPTLDAKVAEDREKVVGAGGLFICGTERHESRRIDNQLRGRAGRQGDPGESRFFLSAEDDLVRLFAGDRIYKILDRLGTTDDEGNEEPIEAGILSKQIEKAQRRVEEQNFLIRKRVLEYDDVMNEQRRVVYAYRDEILEGKDMGGSAREELSHVIERLVDEYTGSDFLEDWDTDGLLNALQDILPGDFSSVDALDEQPDRTELIETLTGDAITLYDQREAELGDELMRALERYLLLQIIDQRWREHLYDMDYLREGIHLRGFAQIDPLVAYKNEAFELFRDLMNTIWSDFARMIFHVEVEVEGQSGNGAEQYDPSTSTGGARQISYSGGVGTAQPSALTAAAAGAGIAPAGYADAEYAEEAPLPVVEQRRVDESEQIGRNDPCWCGSGQKYKKCHGA